MSNGTQQFLWGIPSTQTISKVPVGVFSAASSGVTGPLNSMYVSFIVANAVPLGTKFTVSITLGATGVLIDSLVTNLPSADNT